MVPRPTRSASAPRPPTRGQRFRTLGRVADGAAVDIAGIGDGGGVLSPSLRSVGWRDGFTSVVAAAAPGSESAKTSLESFDFDPTVGKRPATLASADKIGMPSDLECDV